MAVVVGLSLKRDDTSAKIATALKIPCFKHRAGGWGGRSVYGHVFAKFSWMGSLPHFLTHGANQEF